MILEQIYEVKAEQNNTMQICLVWSFEMNPLWTTFSFDFSPFFFFFWPGFHYLQSLITKDSLL